MTLRPYRSVLYIPGSRARALDKARTMPVDSIIFDLEDAVALEEKASARATLVAHLLEGEYGPRSQIIRINGLHTPWAAEDIAAIAEVRPEAVLLPKVDNAQMIAELGALMDRHEGFENTQIWAMMETPRGILNAAEIADAPWMEGMVMGTNDLAKELQCRFRADRLPMLTSLQLCLLAAKAEGLVIVDGVYNAFKDDDGLALECEQGRDMGFDGKTLIHPAQVAVTNTAFAPSDAEIDLANRQIAAFEAAKADGQGVAVVDGRIVENLHVASAGEILAKAKAIDALAKE